MIKCHNCILIETEERWPTKAEVMGSDIKYVCGMPPLSEIAGTNVSEELKNLFENERYPQVHTGDIKTHLLTFTNIQLPSMNATDYVVINHLREGLDMLTFDGREENKPMGIIAGSYPSFKGNIVFFDYICRLPTKPC